MSIHSLLRHVGIDVPEVIYIDQKAVKEHMNTRHSLRVYFGDEKFVPLREFMEFWRSLSFSEQEYYLNAQLV